MCASGGITKSFITFFYHIFFNAFLLNKGAISAVIIHQHVSRSSKDNSCMVTRCMFIFQCDLIISITANTDFLFSHFVLIFLLLVLGWHCKFYESHTFA